MANNHEKCSLLAIEKMQIKITLSLSYILIKMAKIRKDDITKYQQRCRDRFTHALFIGSIKY